MEEDDIKSWLKAIVKYLQDRGMIAKSHDPWTLVNDFCDQDPEYQKQYGEWEPEYRPEDHDGYAHPDPWDIEDDGEGEES